MKRRAIQRFGHLEMVWLTSMGLVCVFDGFLRYLYAGLVTWGLLLSYPMWFSAKRLHQPATCTICEALRRSEGAGQHWTVQMYHRERPKALSAGLVLMWVFSQFIMPPELWSLTPWFLVIAMLMAGVDVFWGRVYHGHMSRCGCRKPRGGGPRRRRRQRSARPVPARLLWRPDRRTVPRLA